MRTPVFLIRFIAFVLPVLAVIILGYFWYRLPDVPMATDYYVPRAILMFVPVLLFSGVLLQLAARQKKRGTARRSREGRTPFH